MAMSTVEILNKLPNPWIGIHLPPKPPKKPAKPVKKPPK